MTTTAASHALTRAVAATSGSEDESGSLLGLAGAVELEPSEEERFAAMVAAVAQADRLVNGLTAWRDALARQSVAHGTVLRRATAPASYPDAVAWQQARREAVAEVALACRVPETSLSGRLERTDLIERHMPRLAEAFRAGEVSSWHVHAITDVLGHVPPEVLAAADAALTPRACTTDPSRLRVSTRRWRARHVVCDQTLRTRALADRHVRLAPADDHLAWFTALLPAAQAHAAFHRISDLATAVQGPDETRTLAQLRADVLTALLLDPDATTLLRTGQAAGAEHEGSPVGTVAWRGKSGGPDTTPEVGDLGRSGRDNDGLLPPDWARGVVPTLVLTVPVLSLLGHSDEPADLEGHGPIDLGTARILAAQAPSFLRVLTHPHTGAVLGVGRDRYRVPADLRAVLQLRDATCRFPGCSRRASRCDLDHCTHWQHDGPTDEPNLAHLCRRHHRLKHRPGWTTRLDPDGTLVIRTPSGHEYRTDPAIKLWPPAPAAPPDLGAPEPEPPPDDDEPPF